jgi:hypothetical protein
VSSLLPGAVGFASPLHGDKLRTSFPLNLWLPKTTSGLAHMQRWATLIAGMIALLKLLGGLLVGVFGSHSAREAERAFLRQQLVVLQRSAPARLRLRTADRVIFVWLCRLFPSLREAAIVFKPESAPASTATPRWSGNTAIS